MPGMDVLKPPEASINRSPRIDPEKCRTCGECCKTFKLFYPGGLPREKYDEMIRILYCDGINATIEEGDGGHWLIFHHPCKFLNEEDGEYSCELYGDPCRPMICATFPYPSSTQRDCPHISEVD